MTLTTVANRIEYIASSVVTVYPYPFLITRMADLLVYHDGVLQTSGYTVSGVGLGNGGNVTYATAPATGVAIVFLRATDQTQQVNLIEGDRLPAEPVEGMFDKVYALAQDLWERTRRAVKVPATSINATIPVDLPDPANPANQDKVLFLNGSGQLEARALAAGTTIGDPIVAQGDLIQGSGLGTPERLPIGPTAYVLTVVAGRSAWQPSAILGGKPLGADLTILSPDSTQPDGLRWRAPHEFPDADYWEFATMVAPPAPGAGRVRLYYPLTPGALPRPSYQASGGVEVNLVGTFMRQVITPLVSSALETTIGTFQISGGAFNVAGRAFRIDLSAPFLNNTGGGNGLTLRVKLGGVLLGTVNTGNLGSNATQHGLRMTLYFAVMSAGASAAYQSMAQLWVGNVGVAGASVGLQAQDFSTGIGTLDLTIAQVLTVTAQLSVSHAQLALNAGSITGTTI